MQGASKQETNRVQRKARAPLAGVLGKIQAALNLNFQLNY